MAVACLPGKTGSTSAKDSSSFWGYTQGFPTPDTRSETWGTELSLKLKSGLISPGFPDVVSRTGTQLSSQPSARAELHSADPRELGEAPVRLLPQHLPCHPHAAACAGAARLGGAMAHATPASEPCSIKAAIEQ